MTIEEIKNLTNWNTTLLSKSVYIQHKTHVGILRIISVGKKYVHLMKNNGDCLKSLAEDIVSIHGL
jgi:hypothetical protein